MTTLINQKNGRVLIHATSNVNSNVASFSLSGDTFTDLQIDKIVWGNNKDVYIKRGTDTVLYFPGNTAGDIDLASRGMAVSLNSSANVVINLDSGSSGFVILELKKMITSPATYDYYEN